MIRNNSPHQRISAPSWRSRSRGYVLLWIVSMRRISNASKNNVKMPSESRRGKSWWCRQTRHSIRNRHLSITSRKGTRLAWPLRKCPAQLCLPKATSSQIQSASKSSTIWKISKNENEENEWIFLSQFLNAYENLSFEGDYQIRGGMIYMSMNYKDYQSQVWFVL